MSDKTEWPEVVGKTGEEAKAHILKEHSELNVQVMNELSPCTADYRVDRVRVFVNKDGQVVAPPRTG